MPYRLIMTTCPNMESAESLASVLIGEHLAACVNIMPAGRSVYAWQGQVVNEVEHVLLIKSRVDRLPMLETKLLELHPYELPELIAVPVTEGFAPYLSWIDTQLDKNE